MCPTCKRHNPSLQQVPCVHSDPPTTPFECIAADYFNLNGSHYLVCADRLSGWIDVYGAPAAGSKGLIACLRSLFCAKGVPVELSSDGGPEFTVGNTRAFLESWGVRHSLSLAYHPQSNGRAEAAVKSAKRMMRDNTKQNGSLDHDISRTPQYAHGLHRTLARAHHFWPSTARRFQVYHRSR